MFFCERLSFVVWLFMVCVRVVLCLFFVVFLVGLCVCVIGVCSIEFLLWSNERLCEVLCYGGVVKGYFLGFNLYSGLWFKIC